MRASREIERKAEVEPNRHADLIAWLNAEADRLDDHAAQDELDGEGLEVSSDGIERLRRRAEVLSLAAEILESEDPAIPPGACAVAAQIRWFAAGDRKNRSALQRAADALELTSPPWPDNLAVPIPAGDPRVRLGLTQSPPLVPVRVLSEANYQHALRCVNELDAERELRLLAELEVERLRETLSLLKEHAELKAEDGFLSGLAAIVWQYTRDALEAPPPSFAELVELVAVVDDLDGRIYMAAPPKSAARYHAALADVLAAYPFLREGREG